MPREPLQFRLGRVTYAQGDRRKGPEEGRASLCRESGLGEGVAEASVPRAREPHWI